MALVRFPVEKYASLELNQVAFPKTGMVVSQTPLGPKFVEGGSGNYGLCENGMWVTADKAKGYLDAPADGDGDSPIGIVYTAEKEYDDYHMGLKNFAQKAGDYPRVGIFGLGDTVTTNCFKYDGSTYATVAAIEAVLAAYATTPVYVFANDGDPVPQVSTSAPSAGVYGKVTKYYTVPNGEKAIKYEIVHI